MQIRRIARLGTGFLSFCFILASVAMIDFMIDDGVNMVVVASLLAFIFGSYLFLYMTIKGRVPKGFTWLE
ncbi:hypothetical protein ACFO4O_16610 [Glaciecola siphonariae]|uniref:Uncharacterized protein n=1 Tax=Glaciecola siphonariae TaxID=521012 RepID=A0ABV9LZL4_9ALTE